MPTNQSVLSGCSLFGWESGNDGAVIRGGSNCPPRGGCPPLLRTEQNASPLPVNITPRTSSSWSRAASNPATSKAKRLVIAFLISGRFIVRVAIPSEVTSRIVSSSSTG